MPRSSAKPKPEEIEDDDDGQPNRVHRSIGQWPSALDPKRATPASVFTAATPGQRRPRQRAEPLDLDTVVIRKGVPLPDATHTSAVSKTYGELLRKMKPGDMVELTGRQMRNARNHAKRQGIKVVRRQIGPDLFGLWRVE